MDALNKLFGGMRIAASGLRAERTRVDTIAKNIANAQVTKMPDTGEAYRREVVHFAPILRDVGRGLTEIAGVEVTQIAKDFKTPFERVFDRGHKDADADGYVSYPNVNTVGEMADLITAMRAYEANLTVQENFEKMAERALRLAE